VNFSIPFIHRPVATTLLTAAILLAGLAAFFMLPVSPLPQMDLPTITVQASLPGASPETMASTVATPLERALGYVAGITEMTSSSVTGSTRITMQFDLNRNIDGAASDVQAAINAARKLLPPNLPRNPTYYKVNPADAPIMILSLTSDMLPEGMLYDAASTVLTQKISQIDGIGQVTVGGSSLPAVRVELNPNALTKYGISTESVRNSINDNNPNRPKGALEDDEHQWQIEVNDHASKAADYRSLIIAYRHGAPVRLSDVSEVEDSVEDVRNAGSSNGKPSVLLVLYKQPKANIIETVEQVTRLLPQLRHSISPAIDLAVVMDRTSSIRASLHETESTLLIAVALVMMIVLLFLRHGRAALIPAVALPVSLIGTFGVMYLFGYSIDNLSLMALTIATGFVVDDAVVVLENTMRHIEEEGLSPLKATLRSVREVGPTVVSMSVSLVAVFIPILLMGGVVGRLFREFAVTLSASILVSLFVSLTMTPMMCAHLLRRTPAKGEAGTPSASERLFAAVQERYRTTLALALTHRRTVLFALLGTVALTVCLYMTIPKGFFPEQDTGRLQGAIQADQDISFQAMKRKFDEFIAIIHADPAVENVVGFTGGGQRDSGSVYIMLRPMQQRKATSAEIIARLQAKLAGTPGVRIYLQEAQEIHIGGRQGGAQYQYTVQAEDVKDLRFWAPRIAYLMRHMPQLKDIVIDERDRGAETSLILDRDTLYQLGLTPAVVDNTLNDAFGQRLVSNIFNPLNQYHVIMEVAPQYWQDAGQLEKSYVVKQDGTAVPFNVFSHYEPSTASLSLNHQGQFPATTISFNLAPGVSLSEASDAINARLKQVHLPPTVHGSFQGAARVFESSLKNQPILILVALVTIYIVLGVLYESYIHPITILSTLPSAGIGALLALLLFRIEFTVIAFIGVVLLIGIVKKNAIMMIDLAIAIERGEGKPAEQAIYEACLLRLRPILMTTLTALFGALPLALAAGDGAELRQPLGVAIVGGLIVSQMLTLYTTPVLYLYFDALGRKWRRARNKAPAGAWVGHEA